MNAALRIAVLKLMRPLVRILLRYGVSFAEFAELAKAAYVQSAEEDFPVQGRKPSVSRIAVLTGLHRKEVARLRQDEHQVDAAAQTLKFNRGRRILSGWYRDAQYLDEAQQPRALPLEGEDSFASLVKQYSGDMPVRAVLDELIRVGAVKKTPQDTIELSNPSAYIPSAEKDALFHYMGGAAADLLYTLDHNLEAEAGHSRLQLTTSYDNLSADTLEQFRQLAPAQAKALLLEMDKWLGARDRDSQSTTEPAEGGRYRAGLGIYFIEEVIEP